MCIFEFITYQNAFKMQYFQAVRPGTYLILIKAPVKAAVPV